MGGRARRTGRTGLDLEETKYKSYERDHRVYNPQEKVGWLDDQEAKQRYVVMLGRELWIGRNAACDIVVSDPHVSFYQLKLCAVRTSTSQVVVSIQDVSKSGYIINGVHRIPQAPLKLRNTAISTRTAVLCSGDVLELPEVDLKLRFHQRRTHTFSAWPVDLQCTTPSLFPTADPAISLTVAPWVVKNYPLGHGTFGQVYLATQTALPAMQVACKTVDLRVTAKQNIDIQREIAILRALSHPNICGILDTTYGTPNEKEGQSSIVHLFMPLVLGGDLFSYMEKHRNLNEDEVRFAAKQLVDGIAYLHKKKVAHRDIKPENILLRCSSAYPHLLLADFGLAVSYSDVLATVPASKVLNVTRTYGNAGTEPYMPPEQLGGVLGRNKGIQGWGESIHGRAEWREAVANKWFGDEMAWDKWSLGVVLFQLISGCHPYDQTADMDAPGEEIDEDMVAAERKKQTAAQSWKSFRLDKGQGALKVGQTARDQVRSKMYDAAGSFASSAKSTWYPQHIWAGVSDPGKSFIQALTADAPHKRSALSTLTRHAWFEPVKAELDEMYDMVVMQGRLGGGLGSQRPGLGGMLISEGYTKTSTRATVTSPKDHAEHDDPASSVGSGDDTAVETLVDSTPLAKVASRVLVPPSTLSKRQRQQENEQEETVEETVYSVITAKPSKRRRVLPDSIPEAPGQRAERDREGGPGGEADESASSESTAVEREAQPKDGDDKTKGKGKGKGKATVASRKAATAAQPAGAGKAKGKGKAAAAPKSDENTNDAAPARGTPDIDIFPSASQQRASLFIPNRDIFGSQQETLATLASVSGTKAGEARNAVDDRDQAQPTSSSDTDSDKLNQSIKTLKNGRNKVNLAPALPALSNTGSTKSIAKLSAPAPKNTLKTPLSVGPAIPASTIKKAAPIAIKSKTRPSKVQVSIDNSSSGVEASRKSAFAPASMLDVHVD